MTVALVKASDWVYYDAVAKHRLRHAAWKAAHPVVDGVKETDESSPSLYDEHNHTHRDRRHRSLRNERAQMARMRPLMRRLPFTKCGACGEASVYQSYSNPTYAKGTDQVCIDWDRWCYVCGAKDAETIAAEDGILSQRRSITLKMLEELLAKLEKGGKV